MFRRLRLGVPVLFLVVAAGGCTSNSSTRPDVPNGFYPLEPGAIWSYNVGEPDTASAEVSVFGRTYVRLRGGTFGGALVRVNAEDQFVILRDDTVDEESVLFDFAANVGDAWDFNLNPVTRPSVVTLMSNTDSLTVPAGHYEGCYTFLVDEADAVAQDVTFVVAPMVGIIHRVELSGIAKSLTAYTP